MDYHTQISLRKSRNNTYSVNGEGCSKKYRKPYFIIVMTINKHCSITVKPVVIQKKSIWEVLSYSITHVALYIGKKYPTITTIKCLINDCLWLKIPVWIGRWEVRICSCEDYSYQCGFEPRLVNSSNGTVMRIYYQYIRY